jgi:hypothetical protein
LTRGGIPGHGADCVEVKGILRLRNSIRLRESSYSAQDDNVLMKETWLTPFPN